jgi:hypothetical protein
MSLSRKHYCAVAAIIADKVAMFPNDAGASHVQIVARAALAHVAQDLTDYFASDNPAFDRARFLAACKVIDDWDHVDNVWAQPARVQS